MEESSVSSSILLEDFGQKVDLTRRIREVLLNYPEGTTVLKELIQNADDAGATKVRLCLDRRTHPKESLLSENLATWQGPALLAYNDAEFSEEDFVSISRIGGSQKQGQAWKTGRFGVGFNSVYHLTDLPSFVSGKYVVLFDPQGAYLPNVSAANPGKRIEYVSTSAISLYKDQFLPYCVFGCDMEAPFHGTLFRFPLRNADQAANSKLSRQAYLEEDITSLFLQLYEEGVLSLLFLKSVMSIEMYVWDVGFPEPRKIYSCCVDSVDADTVWHRQALLRLSKSKNCSNMEMDSFTLNFISEVVTGDNSEKKTDTFYIVQTMASSSSRIGSFVAKAAKDFDMHLLPWASVAACISDKSPHDNVLQLGRAFCFLPLPVKTGLHVHINGYFEVSSNRRGIWYGDDMDRSGRIRSLWNRLLLGDVMAPSVAELLLGLRDMLGPSEFYYHFWPTGSFEEPWSSLVKEIFTATHDKPLLYSSVAGGRWVSLSNSYLHDLEIYGNKDLEEALVQIDMPVVVIPKGLFSMLLNCNPDVQPKVVTPDTVRHFLKNCRYTNTINRSNKLTLLEYCLEDLVDTEVGSCGSDLPLLPLANGEFGLISEASKGTVYFICNELEYMLLTQISGRLIDTEIPQTILDRLTSIANVSGANVALFSVDELVLLFSNFMPAEWKYKTGVSWDPASNLAYPTASWFKLFWRYLQYHCEYLSLFGDWPILPSLSGHLYRPSKNSKLLNVEGLSEKLAQVLFKIGSNILDRKYGVEHPDLMKYVHPADISGVLESIFDIVSSNDDIRRVFVQFVELEERDELRQFLLDPKWYIHKNINDSQIWKCKRLPVFRVYGAEPHLQYSDLIDSSKYLPPHNSPDSLYGSQFINCATKIEEDVLNRYYGIERMGKAQFYRQRVLDRVKELESEFRDSMMLSILKELPQLCAEDVYFKETLMNLEFIPTSHGFLKKTIELYDPRNEELYALLEDSDSFPSGAFGEPDILDMLQILGLRTTVSPETVILSAKHIENLMHDGQEQAYLKGKILLSYLEVNALKWLPDMGMYDEGTVNRIFTRATNAFKPRHVKGDLEKFWNDLQLISWCPVLTSPPYKSLPWPTVLSKVAPPKLVRLYHDLWLVSASMRILDGECSSSALSHLLGWSSPPGGSVIAAQLLELGKNNEIVSDSLLRQELALAMPKIYSLLMRKVDSDEMDIVKAILEGCRWIWVGDGFATSDEVVLNGPLHLAPYIRVIPIDLAAFKELFLVLGIREFLQPSDYANILTKMASTKGANPLGTLDIRAAILIVQHLAEAPFVDDQMKIYLPDTSCRLFKSSDLVYNDAPWLLDMENAASSSSVTLSSQSSVQRFVHGNISNDVAEKLGVRSFRRMLLAESADSMNISLSGAAEAFGQHEALTTRLRHILEMYADGPSVLFELVQNAEDAKASQVCFLLDKTQYGTSSLLSPEMADWQGPALYCFNDSVFSSQDLYSISRIGQESKLEKPFAIGRFGLGFNCVYHFTDIPTFVSGENVVMFDPHASNLPGISPSHPGLRIKFAGRNILGQFPDQFSPFLHFDCDLQQPYPGTLFRFPLRSATVASRSQIKKETYAPDDVLSLFSSFSEVVSETLLFLRNVKTISIFVKEGANSEMQLLHCVSKNIASDPKAESNPFNEIFGFMHGKEQDKMDRDQFLNKLSKCVDENLPWRCQKIIVSEQSPSGRKSHFWLTSECLGGTGAGFRNISAHFGRNFFKSVPWACVALHMDSLKIDKEENRTDIDGDGWHVSLPESLQILTSSSFATRSFDGRAFCFLPLPVNTGLPVHVNAYFELSSNRRDIWFGNDMAGGGKVRSDWNMYVLEEVVAPAYGHLIETAAQEIGPCDLFFSFWPITEGVEPWRSLVRKLYQFISESGVRVFHTKVRGGQLISAKQAILPDFTFDKPTELIEALCDAGLPIATVPKVLVDRFMEICPSLYFLSPQLLRTLLNRRKREFRDRNAMILTLEYCLLDFKNRMQSDSFCGLPLIPLSNGSFAKLEKRGGNELIYITKGDGYALLKDFIPHQLADTSISDFLYQKLSDVAQSEEFNLSFLTSALLEKLLSRLLPAEWKNSKQVAWVPGNLGHPSLEWIRLLWSYLKLHGDDLSLFTNWPILPVENNYLLQLVENSNVIKDGGWSENMCSLLLKVGCLLLKRDLSIDHPSLGNYVQSSTAVGVLNALLVVAGEVNNIEQLFGDASEGELLELRSFILQSKWFTEDYLDGIYVNIIKNIPMFESCKTRKLVALNNSTKWLKPEGVREEFLNDEFIRTESDKERIILNKYLSLVEPSRNSFYTDFVLTRMHEFINEESILSDILYDVRSLAEDNDSLKSSFSTIPFVQACNGSWKEPCRLYDPRVPELKMLLHGGAFFPSEIFLKPESLDTLVKLGLKQTLSFTGLLDSATSVSMLHDSADPETVFFAKRILDCLNRLALKLSYEEGEGSHLTSQDTADTHFSSPGSSEETCITPLSSGSPCENGLDSDLVLGNLIDDIPKEELWSKIRLISWCPIYSEPLEQGLPWSRSGCKIAAPVMTRPQSQMWMVSCKMSILDGECSDHLAQKLGWMDPLDPEILCAQLIALSNCFKELDSRYIAELNKQIPLIYTELQEFVGKDELQLIRSALDGVPSVWIGDEFVAPKALAFDSPVKFSPYLYVVPSELSEFRDLLLALGVRHSFDVFDYIHVLKRLQDDVKDSPLSTDQFNFVQCVLEAIADYDLDDLMFGSNNTLLIPDSSGVLTSAGNLVYNDAPWIENNTLDGRRFVHPSISCDLANRLGIQSIRSLSLVNEEMTKDIPCMDYGKISELLGLYGDDFILFDLLELADCCKARKLHLIFDKRNHPCQSLLQHNLGEFQGPALLAVMEGASLNGDEIASLQFLPPWSLRGDMVSYGLGLLSCFSICDIPSVISNGCLYIFDPRGLALSTPSSRAPAAKMFSVNGTNLTEKFHDQFSPMIVGDRIPWLSSDMTVIRMPLSSVFLKDATESGCRQISVLFNNFMEHASRTLLFLKSVLQVSLSTWEEGSPQPHQDYSTEINLSSAIARNPFSEKKWKKFQLSNLFSSSCSSIKLQVIDVRVFHGGTRVDDKWLVVLSMGSGQTRNMALDRRYMAYNLTPVAGVAALISRNGNPVQACSSIPIMSPLPLSSMINVPVTMLGCFLVRHNRGRFLFNYQDSESAVELLSDAASQLIEAWNRELMSCVRDSYIKLVLEMHKLRRESSTSTLEPNVIHVVGSLLRAYGDQIYTFWPRSQSGSGSPTTIETLFKADWQCFVQQVIRPFYARLIDFPVWQLYSGNLVKAEEGMFLSQPSSEVADKLLPATVCAFVREHYPVFSVPWELVTEIQALGITVREIKPKMVRDLLRASSTSIVLRSVDTYIDVLEYCLSDIQFPERSDNTSGDPNNSDIMLSSIQQSSNNVSGSTTDIGRLHGTYSDSSSSGGDALELMTNLGKALFDFGRGVVEDIGRAGSPLSQRRPIISGSSNGIIVDRQLLSIASELKGLPCPTSTNHLIRLGFTDIWVGSKDHQSLMMSLASKFIHPKVLDRSILQSIFCNGSLQSLLKLEMFSFELLAMNMSSIFNENWVSHVIDSNTAPWFSWNNTASSSTEVGPSSEWIRLFWKLLGSSSEDISLFSDWPLIPAFLGRPVLCRVRERHLIFIPALDNDFNTINATEETGNTENNHFGHSSESEIIQSCLLSFKATEVRYPWLFSLLNQCNIPIFDTNFLDCALSCKCLPSAGQSLGQVISLKLVAAKQVGYLSELTSISATDRDELFSIFASDFSSSSVEYGREQLEVLRDLPIYKTVLGTYETLQGQDLCIISSSTFLKPNDDRCLSFTTESAESSLLRALGVPELQDKQILVQFGLPKFKEKTQAEQEDILIYLYTNWQELQQGESVIEVLREADFVKNADQQSTDLCKPRDLYDPTDALLASIFSGVRKKFPGERFVSDEWLRILRKAGLRTSAETDVVLDCAKRVESLGGECMKPMDVLDDLEGHILNSQNEVSLEIWLLAENLMKTIFSNFAVLYGNNFCNLLGKIACVPAEKGFPNIGGRGSAKRVLCSYSDAIILRDWALAWCCAPILSRQSVVPPEYAWEPLHLKSPPAFSHVLNHLQVIGRNSGEDTLAHWPTATGVKTIDKASYEVFRYLDKIWGSLSSTDIMALKQVAFVPVANGTRLVTASSLFARLSINLSPFAFELPTRFLPFVNILKDLGLRDTLSVSSAKDLLSDLQKACGYQRLNPNEFRAVLEILYFICDEANATDATSWASEAIVPDDGCRLVHARSCVFIDFYGAHYVKHIDISRLRFVHQDLPETVCKALNIRKLSDVVVEVSSCWF
ncbi:hypothetical protein LIER_08123 [Lithospermum erythrorhizon]|uniref:Sacsin/Nov domain-containing protein n=1 Tax=Lithospermum erythrorhizon TaxID=34254 RepID=A0AAV3PC33_LITER